MPTLTTNPTPTGVSAVNGTQMDTVVFDGYYCSLTMANGYLRFLDKDGFDDWLTPYSFHGTLSGLLKNDDYANLLSDFLLFNNFAYKMDTKLEADEELYMSDKTMQFADVLFKEFFPIYAELFPAEQWNDGFYGYFPITSDKARDAIRCKDLKSFTETLFGVYRKDLVKLLTSEDTNVYNVMWAALFAEHIPADWVINYIKNSDAKIDYGYSVKVSDVNIFLNHFSKFEVRKFMNNSKDAHLFAETVRIFAGIPVEKQVIPDVSSRKRTNVTFLHDYFTLVSKNIEFDATFTVPVEVMDWDGHILGTPVGAVEVNVLKSREEFYTTGEIMNNCAGSVNYTVDAVENRLVLIRFDKINENENNEPYVLMELNRDMVTHLTKTNAWKVRQLFLANNEKVDSAMESTMNNFVVNNINGEK